MDNMVDEYTDGEYTVRIYLDDGAEDPRECFDHASNIVCWHDRYTLGDKNQREEFPTPENFNNWRFEFGEKDYTDREFRNKNTAMKFRELHDKCAAIMPIRMYDHSGISISTGNSYPYNDSWDSGWAGYVYMTKKGVRKEFNVKKITEVEIQKSLKLMQAEVDEYNYYLKGEVFGCVITGPESDGDSCWGFYGYEDVRKSAKESVEYLVKRAANVVRFHEDVPIEEMAEA